MLLIRPPSSLGSGSAGTAPDHTALWHWARSLDGQRIAAHGTIGSAELDSLPDRAATVLVVPASWLSWHRIRLPQGRAGRTQAVIAGLLEDAVLDDPAALHVALEPHPTRADRAQGVWAAVCRRDALLATLEPLRQRGWTVHALVPEVAPAPTWLAWAYRIDDIPYLTLAGPEGVLCLPLGSAPLVLPWELSVSQAWAEPGALEAVERAAPHWPWALIPSGQLWLHPWNAGWNLAQFDLKARVGGAWWQRLAQQAHAIWQAPAWRPARWALATLAAIPALAVPALAWQSQRQEHALRAALQQAARAALPGTPVLLDPARQVHQAVARERARTGTATPHAVERLLHAWGDTPDLPPLRMLAVDGERIRLQPLTPVNAPRLQAALGARGWTVAEDSDGRWTVSETGGAP